VSAAGSSSPSMRWAPKWARGAKGNPDSPPCRGARNADWGRAQSS
jgi:hypothetical protein